MVAIIDQAMAEFLFPGQDPIGQRIRTYWDVPREIVGIVGNVNNTGLGNDAQPTDYVPYMQTPMAAQTLIVRTVGDPLSLAKTVQAAIWELDAALPVYSVESLEDRLATSIAAPRFNTVLLGLFAVLAMVLAGVGIYGVMAYNVGRRTREFGIRLALGASGNEVKRSVFRQGSAIVGIGILGGLAGAFLLSRLIRSMLFGVGATDPLTFVLVPLVLASVALLAGYLPARRATKVDPVQVLRQD